MDMILIVMLGSGCIIRLWCAVDIRQCCHGGVDIGLWFGVDIRLRCGVDIRLRCGVDINVLG